MDDHFTITIHDDKGIKQFNVHNLLKRFMLYGIFLIGIIVFLGVGASFYLYSNITQIQKSNEILEQRNQYLQNNRESIESKLEKKQIQLIMKETQLNELSTTLQEIETLIGISSEQNTTIDKRVNITKLNSEHIATLLQFIPSGFPLLYRGITSGYGERIHPITQRKEFHRGLDLRAKRGTPVYATADGVIEWAGLHKKSGYGKLVIIRHSYGFKSYYGHLKKVLVKYNSCVKKGDIIGLSGNTGRSSGPHLHYELKFLYRTINPNAFTKWSIDNFQEIFKKENSIPWNSILEVTKNIKVTQPTKVVPLSILEYKEKQNIKVNR